MRLALARVHFPAAARHPCGVMLINQFRSPSPMSAYWNVKKCMFSFACHFRWLPNIVASWARQAGIGRRTLVFERWNRKPPVLPGNRRGIGNINFVFSWLLCVPNGRTLLAIRGTKQELKKSPSVIPELTVRMTPHFFRLICHLSPRHSCWNWLNTRVVASKCNEAKEEHLQS